MTTKSLLMAFGFPNDRTPDIRLPGRGACSPPSFSRENPLKINGLVISESLARLLLYTVVDSFNTSACLVRPPLKRYAVVRPMAAR